MGLRTSEFGKQMEKVIFKFRQGFNFNGVFLFIKIYHDSLAQNAERYEYVQEMDIEISISSTQFENILKISC